MAGLCSIHQTLNLDCTICQASLKVKPQLIAFTVRPGCENLIDSGGVDVYVVPEQPVTIKAFYDNQELAKWLIRYNAKAEISKVPSPEIIDVIIDVIAEENVVDGA